MLQLDNDLFADDHRGVIFASDSILLTGLALSQEAALLECLDMVLAEALGNIERSSHECGEIELRRTDPDIES